MSLIVAKILNGEIQILSDTRITDISLGPQNPVKGQQKSFILHPFVSISFSGIPSYAHEVLERYYSGKLLNIDHIIQVCLEINRKSENGTHFIIATIINNHPKLFKVKNLSVENNLQSTWIGDDIAFNKYQEYYHTSTKTNQMAKMEDAFDKVVENGELTTVGDFIIRITDETDTTGKVKFLGYQINRITLSGPFAPLQLKYGRGIVRPANAEAGGYGLTLLKSCNPYLPAVAKHFHVGKVGMLFFSKYDYTKPIIFKDQEDGENFALEIKNRFGIEMFGLVMRDDGSLQHINTTK